MLNVPLQVPVSTWNPSTQLFYGVFDITFVANVVFMPLRTHLSALDMISEVHVYYLVNLKGSSAIHG